MSKGINKVILIGNLGRDPELSFTPSGMAVCRLNMATTESRKRDDGTWEDITEWHRITVWGKTGESLGQNASKGSQLYIEGRIHYDSYEKDGIKRYTTDIIARTVRILGRREEGAGGGSGGGGRSGNDGSYSNSTSPVDHHSSPDGDIEDDLPF